MDDSKHKAAVDALNNLILSELQSEERGRFGSVQRLATIAQKLLMANTGLLRPEDAREHVRGLGEFDVGDIGGAMMGGGHDQAQMVREMLAAFKPAMSSQETQNVAREREAIARELNQLISARAKMSPVEAAPVIERIDRILKEMKTWKEDEDGLSLVPTLDVRGREAGARFGEPDEACADRAIADGERGCTAIVPARHEERPDQEGVGYGG